MTTADDIKNSVVKNAEDTGKEAHIQIKNPKKTRDNEPPMQVDGVPSIKNPKPQHPSMAVKIEKDGKLIDMEVKMKRLTVADREFVGFSFLDLFKQLGALTPDGIDAARLDTLGGRELNLIAQYMRDVGPYFTNLTRDVFDEIPYDQMVKFFPWLLKNEVGFMKFVEDLFSTDNQTT